MTKCTHIYNISHDFCYLWKTEDFAGFPIKLRIDND